MKRGDIYLVTLTHGRDRAAQAATRLGYIADRVQRSNETVGNFTDHERRQARPAH